MQTHTDRRSPSQVKVGHRGGAEQGKVQALTRFFHAHLSLKQTPVVVTFARLAAYNKIEQELVNFVAWFPMEQQEQNFLIKPCVQGLVLNAFGVIPPNDWNNIYISTDTPCAKTS